MIRRWQDSSYVQRPTYLYMNTFSSESLVNLPVSSQQDAIEVCALCIMCCIHYLKAQCSQSDQWVTCKFAPHSDTLLYLGSNHGFVAAFDVRNSYGNNETLEGGILACEFIQLSL